MTKRPARALFRLSQNAPEKFFKLLHREAVCDAPRIQRHVIVSRIVTARFSRRVRIPSRRCTSRSRSYLRVEYVAATVRVFCEMAPRRDSAGARATCVRASHTRRIDATYSTAVTKTGG